MDELEVHIIYLIDSRAHNNLFPVISFDPQKYKGMMEKIDITDTSVINAITRQLNIKNIRNEMFPTWRLTLQPGEEYDLKTSYYGMYMVRWADAGTTALIMIGAGVSANILLNNGASISTDFTEVGKIILNKKAVNGTVFVKNNGNKETGINVMQITNY
ncbi:hypothetical protein DW051_17955 [Bacteroides uniformis]|jgi:hypothetical protein|nr:hypothetical protein DW051_17955 [Bacteroides uniformis]